VSYHLAVYVSPLPESNQSSLRHSIKYVSNSLSPQLSMWSIKWIHINYDDIDLIKSHMTMLWIIK